jgi:hypothetical protein
MLFSVFRIFEGTFVDGMRKTRVLGKYYEPPVAILTGVLVDRMKMTGSWVDVILVCFIFEGMFVGGMKMTSVLDG